MKVAGMEEQKASEQAASKQGRTNTQVHDGEPAWNNEHNGGRQSTVAQYDEGDSPLFMMLLARWA